ncbi:Secreted effector protein pipB2 [Symmachiella dynata]|uniref:Secreted effector protein pipB2 n=1 Tax=Symmachiella dynata TaxID=2527995 RepID=A0A517ZVW0_9PLAN|nr:pentapeptide repeat-containing protein [Symmachiella dynata]QDU46595.1 Secreted effector protein pipB2 [Symmachiella dynata]
MNREEAIELLRTGQVHRWNARRSTPEAEPNLSNVDFDGFDIPGASFKGIDLSGANLSNTKLTNAVFLETNLEGANLANALLSKATFRGAKMAGCDFSHATVTDAKFENCDLRGVVFNRTNLSSSNLSGAKLNGIDFRHSKIHQTILTGANLSNAKLDNCDLLNAELNNATLTQATLIGANLINCKLNDAVMIGADLEKAALERASLQHADLRDARLFMADLSKTNLQDAKLNRSNLIGAKFDSGFLRDADLLEVVIDSTTRFNSETDVRGCKVDRYTMEYMRENIPRAVLMDLEVRDDIARLRSQYSGVWMWSHVLSVIIFAAPYVWFVCRQWVVAHVQEKVPIPSESIPLWKALFRFIWNGGEGWREGWSLAPGSFFPFCLVLIYSALRVVLLWKTKKLETQQDVTGLPVQFSLGHSFCSWNTLYSLSYWGYFVSLILVFWNTLHFFSIPVPISLSP